MEHDNLEARMLGGFFLRRGDAVLEVKGRSRKLYLLLAYLIRERDRDVSHEELAAVLWPGEELDETTWRSLKALLHRARAFLDGLGGDTGKCLLNREGMCRWNPEVPLRLDAEEFRALCGEGRGGGGVRLDCCLRALELYRGDLLPAAGDCPWAAEERDRLHRLWLEMVQAVLPLLAGGGQWERTAALAEEALVLEPCREDLCRGRMEALLALGRKQEAAKAYESFQEALLAQRGVLPSDGLRELYSAARNDPDTRLFTPAELPERLREPPAAGALLCGFDFFRVLCFSLVRLAKRAGQPLYAALLTLSGEREGLPRYSLDRAMNNLQGTVLSCLRRGDAAARCSACQFVLLLPQAGYEGAQKACRRICRAFSRQFPHAPVRLEFAVVPLVIP